MKQMINDLKEIPGVIGAYTWHTSTGLQNSNLPAVFKADRLNEMASILTNIHLTGLQSFPDLGDSMVCFEEAAALCRQLTPDNFLILVCDADINLNLLTISLNLAVESYLSGDTPSQETEANAGRAPSPQQLKSMQSSGPMAKPLQIMASELYAVMGPMASIVFEEILLNWATVEPPSPARLSVLFDALCTETNDPEKAQKYRQLVSARMGGKSS